jgi:hypothetical protein
MGFNIEQYELGDVYSNGADWSNATGYTKAELISKIRDAKDSIEKLTKDANSAQVKYDEANGRYCANRCGKGNQPKCHSECWSKERDKSNYLGILNGANLAIGTARANIPVWQNELDDLIEKEANTPAPNTGGGTGGGSTPNTGGGTGGGTGTTPKKSNTVLYASIGGAVLILAVVGFMVFRGKTTNN